MTTLNDPTTEALQHLAARLAATPVDLRPPTYNHSREDSALTPCALCAALENKLAGSNHVLNVPEVVLREKQLLIDALILQCQDYDLRINAAQRLLDEHAVRQGRINEAEAAQREAEREAAGLTVERDVALRELTALRVGKAADQLLADIDQPDRAAFHAKVEAEHEIIDAEHEAAEAVATVQSGPVPAPEEWLCSTSEEDWSSGEEYATREDAVAAAIGEEWAKNPDRLPESSGDLDLMPGQRFWSGLKTKITVDQIADVISGSNVIESIQEHLYELVGEAGSDAFEATFDQEKDLDLRLEAALRAWLVEHNLEPECYSIEHTQEHHAPESVHAYEPYRRFGSEGAEYCRRCEEPERHEMHVTILADGTVM